MRPTTRLAVLLGAVACAAVFVPAVVTASAAMAVAALALVDAAVARRPLIVEADLPPRLVVGTPAAFSLRVIGSIRTRATLPPGDHHDVDEAAGTLTARAAGHLRVGPARCQVQGPLGLVDNDRRCGSARRITAFPAAVRGARRPVAALSSRTVDEDGLARGPLGLGTVFESIREYAPGDDVRVVNWLATARQGRPLVNQFRIEQCRTVMILLDRGRMLSAITDGRSALSVAVDVAAAVAGAAATVGDRPGLIAFSDGIDHRVPPSPRAAPAVLRELVAITGSPAQSSLEPALAEIPRTRSIVVLLSNLDDGLSRHQLASAVPALCARHAVIVVSCATAPITSDAPGTPTGAIATAAVSRRVEHTVVTLRRAGAQVVTGDSPGDLPRRTVDAVARAGSGRWS